MMQLAAVLWHVSLLVRPDRRALGLGLVGLYCYLLARYLDYLVRIFHEKPLFVIPRGQPVEGGIWLKAGGGWAGGFTGNVDSLTAAVNVGGVNGTVNFDFEK